MLNLFPSLVMYPLWAIIGSLLIGIVGAALVGYALTRMERDSVVGQGSQRSWYELPLIWVGGCGICIGLMVPVDMVIAALPGIWLVATFATLSFVLLPLLFFVRWSLMKMRQMISFVRGALMKLGLKKQATSAGQDRYASSKDAFIQKSPLLTSIQGSLFVWASFGCMVIWLACGWLLRVIDPRLFTSVLIIGGGLSLFWCINRALVQLPHLKRIERLRAQYAEKSWLASAAFAVPYPFQEPIQLLPPLLLRLTWSFIVGWGLYWVGFFALLLGFPFGLFVASLMGLYYFKLRQKIEATQYGLKMTSGSLTKSILWQDAWLFACYRVPNFFFWEKSTLTYELSSPSEVIQWTCVVDSHTPFAAWQPVDSMDEYLRNVQMLAALISEKTGLPLRDLTALEPIGPHANPAQEHMSVQYQVTD